MSETTSTVVSSEKKASRRDPLSTFRAFAARGPVQQLKACVRHAMQDLRRKHGLGARANVGKSHDEAVTRCLVGEPWAVCTYSAAEDREIAQGGRVRLSVIAEDDARQDEAVGVVVGRLEVRGLRAEVTDGYTVTASLPAPANEGSVTSGPVARAG